MTDLQLVYAPEVYVTATMQVQWDEIKRFLDDHGFTGARLFDGEVRADNDAVVEIAGRGCYQSWDAGRDHEAYIRNILERRDGSVVHHSVFGLIISGVSRSFSFEWIRHKTGISADELDGTGDTDISQLSQRFVDESDVRFVVPPEIRRVGGEVQKAFETACMTALQDYRILTKGLEADPVIAAIPNATDRRKRIRQAARSVLPNAAETRFYVTGNARSFRNLLEQRTAPEADEEFRRVAHQIGLALRRYAPHVFGDYDVSYDRVWTTPNVKV